MPFRCSLPALALMLVSIAWSPAFAQDSNSVKVPFSFPNGARITLQSAGCQTLSIPIDFAPGLVAPPRLEPDLYVRYDGLYGRNYAPSTIEGCVCDATIAKKNIAQDHKKQFAMDIGLDESKAANKVKITLPACLRSGLYTLTSRLSNHATPLRVEVDIKPTRLEAPKRVIIHHNNPIFFDATVTPKTFELHEPTKLARITHLKQVGEPREFYKDTPVRSALSFIGLPTNVSPGTNPTLAFQIDKSVALGITTGQVTLDAVQLENPINIDYTIRSRLYPVWLWIFGFVLLGVFTGYLVRVRLKTQRDLETARGALGKLMGKLQHAKNEAIDDGNFLAQLESCTTRLNKVEQTRSASKIAKETQSVRDLFAQTEQVFNQRLEQAKTRYLALEKLLQSARQLPDLTALTNELTHVQNILANSNATEALALLDALEQKAQNVLEDEGPAWRIMTLAGLMSWMNTQKRLPVFIRDACMAPAQKACNALEAIDFAIPENPYALYEALRRAHILVQVAADEALAWWALESKEIVRLLEAKKLSPIKLKDLGNSVRPSKQLSLEEVLKQLPEYADKFNVAFRKALGEQRVETVRVQLDAYDYREAARQVPMKEQRGHIKSLQEGPSRAPVELDSQMVMESAPTGAETGAAPSRPSLVELPTQRLLLSDPDAFVHQVEKRVWQLDFLQGMFSLFVLTAVVYAGYGDTFAGTFSELSAIVAVAFTTDMSLEGVVKTAKGMKS